MRFVPTGPAVHPFHHKRPQADFGFNPLLEILSAVESEVTSAQQQAKRRRTVINPNFDIRETEGAFLLEGELPGVSDREAIEIEFVDAQTLVVRGEIKRRSPAGLTKTESTQPQEEEQQTTTATTETDNESVRSLKPTVEEAVDESVSENGEASSTTEKGKEVAKPAAEKTTVTKKAKYWLSERSVGTFERKFEFQELIDQENVRASLEHGVLEIVVPKRQPYVKKVQIL